MTLCPSGHGLTDLLRTVTSGRAHVLSALCISVLLVPSRTARGRCSRAGVGWEVGGVASKPIIIIQNAFAKWREERYVPRRVW